MACMKGLLVLAVAAWTVGCLVVPSPAAAEHWFVSPKEPGANDNNPGTEGKPWKTLGKALEKASGGDTIWLGTGEYPAVSISKTYEKPLTIRAVKGAKPALTGGLSIAGGGGLRLSGLVFTWADGKRPGTAMTTFVAINGSKDVEIAECEIYDDPKLTEWVGWACNISDSERITVRDSKAHHFYFGFSAYKSKDITFRNLDVGPWTHEDAFRVTECEGPILIEGCHACNMVVAGRKGGHVDALQVVHWADNLTIRNCHFHGAAQGIGAFGRSGRRSKNWRIEGNLIYDVYAPHVATVCECDGVVVVNNTFPQNRPILSKCTGGVMKNNIIGATPSGKVEGADCDYNLYTGRGTKVGEHDLVGVDPEFVNSPLETLKSDSRRKDQLTQSKFFFPGSLAGRIAVGDVVEVVNSDGSARDGKGRKVTAAGNDWIEVDPPIANPPDWAGVTVYKWPAGTKNMVPDYRLKADSPAIDSADSSVKREKDRDGHEPTDARNVANTGAGPVKFLDRGAFEFTPGK
ncbi:MAG: right-handed parallel beta-helix repeat-containing protein [Planctomycetes bacterium]|nr:right-handed parallel beta-helix repeat-containing protein [Planctomycetota bacterium]